MTTPGDEIIMYGTSWCGDTIRARRWFDSQQIPYRYIDIEKDPQARQVVEQINNGMRSVPTILFPDGTILVEPSNAELAEKFKVKI